MGLGQLFHRGNVTYTATDSGTGQTQSWVVVDDLAPSWSRGEYQGGMGIPGAWRASLLLADLLASFPWHAYRERAGRPPVLIEPCPPLIEQPNPPDPRVVTFTSLALDLIWHGNGIGVIATRNRDGWPTSIVPVPAEYVHVRRANEADSFDFAVPLGAVVYRIGTRTFSPHDVIHIKGPCRPGELRGMGVLENHLAGTLTLASDQSRQATASTGGGIPTGVLKVEDTPDEPLEQDEADEVKANWMRSQQTRTVAVLNGRTSFEALAWNPTDAQLLESRRFSLHEIALIFGLDPSWLGVASDSQTYQNVETKGADLVRYSALAGHLARFEQTLSLHMPRGTWTRANLDALLRGTTQDRYAAHEAALRAGWMTADEVRALEDMPPLTPAQRAVLAPRPPAAPAPTSDAPEEGTDA